MKTTRYVPGLKCAEQPLDVQAEMLTTKLAGHKIFARMRGKVEGFPLWTLLDGESKESPSSSLQQYDSFVSDLRVMRNLVVWLRWHGYRKAAAEIIHALANSDYRIWCEEVPFDATIPGTLLMFQPTETLRLCRWWSNGGYNELDTIRHNHIMEQREKDFVPSRHPSRETLALLKLYPELDVGKNYSMDCQPSIKVFRSIMKERINDSLILQGTAAAQMEFDSNTWMYFCGKNFPLYAGGVVEVNDRTKMYDNGAFAFFFPKMEQGEVLSWFPREIQKKIATWQMHIPESTLRGVAQLRFGLHPESEHALWSKLYPSMVSKGVTQGLGVLLSPTQEYVEDTQHLVLRSW